MPATSSKHLWWCYFRKFYKAFCFVLLLHSLFFYMKPLYNSCFFNRNLLNHQASFWSCLIHLGKIYKDTHRYLSLTLIISVWKFMSVKLKSFLNLRQTNRMIIQKYMIIPIFLLSNLETIYLYPSSINSAIWGTILSTNCRDTNDVRNRIKRASNAFWALRQSLIKRCHLWKSKRLCLRIAYPSFITLRLLMLVSEWKRISWTTFVPPCLRPKYVPS